jgi:hypothetical protein
MGRQILTVLAGILLSILSVAAGNLIYRLSAQWPQRAPALARYAVGPIIVVLVGICVGIFAKSHPGLLACLSLLPGSIVFVVLPCMGLNFTNCLLVILLGAVEMLVAAVVAKLTFRIRRRTRQVAQ